MANDSAYASSFNKGNGNMKTQSEKREREKNSNTTWDRGRKLG